MTEVIGGDQIATQVWAQLQRASVDRHHEWRTPVLASNGLDGSVQARTVVLRRVVVETKDSCSTRIGAAQRCLS